MGNTNPDSKALKIYIETEKQFYNSGSSIEGVVFIEAAENFRFDALYLRIEGTHEVMKERNGASGSRGALPTGASSQAATLSIVWSICWKSTRTRISKKGSMPIPFLLNSLKIYRALSSHPTTTPR
jgi:hypothetical protein